MRLSLDEARRLFSAARVARLATVDAAGQPHLVPVTFVVEDDTVLHAVDDKPKSTTALKRLANIAAHPVACALADHYEDDWARLWWVRVDGTAAIRHDHAEVARVGSLLAAKYNQYGERPPGGPVVALTAWRWTGWSAVPSPAVTDPG